MPQKKGDIGLLIDDVWHTMTIKPEFEQKDDPVKELDCDMLTEYCFKRILGIENIREDERVEFVGGIRGIAELEYRCNKDCVVAFAMFPISMDEIFAVADQQKIMPPKCTWYEPKPRSGFVVNVFNE